MSREVKTSYENSLSRPEDIASWILEGPATIQFKDGWLDVKSDVEKAHVHWCPEVFPGSFEARWEVQNLNPAMGLCIVFFAARGAKGEDLFDSTLPKRDGLFKQYILEKIVSYHISYYANMDHEKSRNDFSHLRKNNMFAKVSEGPIAVPAADTKPHSLHLIKRGAHIQFFCDDRPILDWKDDGQAYGPVYGGGRFGLRQMWQTHFRYRNLRITSL